MSQEALGDRIGVSKVTISDLERGGMKFDTEYMRRIARALGVNPSDLLSRSDNPLALTIEELQLFQRLRRAEPGQRDLVHRVAEAILGERAE